MLLSLLLCCADPNGDGPSGFDASPDSAGDSDDARPTYVPTAAPGSADFSGATSQQLASVFYADLQYGPSIVNAVVSTADHEADYQQNKLHLENSCPEYVYDGAQTITFTADGCVGRFYAMDFDGTLVSTNFGTSITGDDGYRIYEYQRDVPTLNSFSVWTMTFVDEDPPFVLSFDGRRGFTTLSDATTVDWDVDLWCTSNDWPAYRNTFAGNCNNDAWTDDLCVGEDGNRGEVQGLGDFGIDYSQWSAAAEGTGNWIYAVGTNVLAIDFGDCRRKDGCCEATVDGEPIDPVCPWWE